MEVCPEGTLNVRKVIKLTSTDHSIVIPTLQFSSHRFSMESS